MQITSSQHQQQFDINYPSPTFTITIESNVIDDRNGDNIDINDIILNSNNELLFSEDYWYSFQPLQLDTKVDGKLLQNNEKRRYKVHRILKQNSIDSINESRRLQSEEESVGSNVVEESNPIDKSEDTNNNSQEPSSDESNTKEEYIELVTNSLLSLVCVTMAALAAGLTMGMLSLDVSILFVCVVMLFIVV